MQNEDKHQAITLDKKPTLFTIPSIKIFMHYQTS